MDGGGGGGDTRAGEKWKPRQKSFELGEGGGGVTNGQGKLEIPAKMRELIQWSSGKNIKFRKFYQYILGVRE